MSLADTVSRRQLVSELVVMVLKSKGSTIGGISTPLANGVSMAAVTGGSVSVSTSGRPGSESRGSKEDRGVSTPLAVSRAVRKNESRVDPGNMLGGSAESRMSLADTVSGGQLVSELVVMVLQSKGSTIGRISTPLSVSRMELSARLEGSSESRVRLADCVSGSQFMTVHVVSVFQSHSSSNIRGVSTPLTVSRMELSARLEGSSESRVRLADCVSGSQFMTVHVVSVLQSHSSSNIGGISTPLTNGVSMAAVTGGCVSVSTNGRPGSKSRGSVEDRGRGGHSQEGGEHKVLHSVTDDTTHWSPEL